MGWCLGHDFQVIPFSKMEKNAKQLLEKAIELDPNLAPAHFKLGVLYQNEKDFDSAILHFEKAVALDTSFPAAECELAVELCRAQKNLKMQESIF